MEMQIAVAGTSVSAAGGRTRKWFDSLTKKAQKDYLAKHPNSKFGKKAGAGTKTRKTAGGKVVKRAPTVRSMEGRRSKIRKAIESHNSKTEGGRGKALTVSQRNKLQREDKRLLRQITQLDDKKYGRGDAKRIKNKIPRGTPSTKARPGTTLKASKIGTRVTKAKTR